MASLRYYDSAGLPVTAPYISLYSDGAINAATNGDGISSSRKIKVYAGGAITEGGLTTDINHPEIPLDAGHISRPLAFRVGGTTYYAVRRSLRKPMALGAYALEYGGYAWWTDNSKFIKPVNRFYGATAYKWAATGYTGVALGGTSLTNGYINCANQSIMIDALSAPRAQFPSSLALDYTNGYLGYYQSDFYLPAINELIAVLNATGSIWAGIGFWSSTEYNASYAYVASTSFNGIRPKTNTNQMLFLRRGPANDNKVAVFQ